MPPMTWQHFLIYLKVNISFHFFFFFLMVEIMWSYSLLNYLLKKIGFSSRFTFLETFYAIVSFELSFIMPDNNG